MAPPSTPQWQFWIDRGGTFTDIVAQRPDGSLVGHKLLSEHPERYADATIQGIRDLLQVPAPQPLPSDRIACVKLGTTLATNALLERRGDRPLLLITKGYGDALRLGYQHRPDIFARQIILPDMLYDRVIEVDARYSAQGEELQPLVIDTQLQGQIRAAYEAGMRTSAIVLLHSYHSPQHEQQLAHYLARVGFSHISCSHHISPLIKLIGRGDTTVVDAYLSPLIRRYVAQLRSALGPVPLLLMQSNGGLTLAERFQGKDSILSGPAGGIVGAVQTSALAQEHKIIGFDMGGTSTDVCHFAGNYERTLATTIAGVRLQTPQLDIHTVAAGGGSILHFDGSRYRVGPDSAGANPGPACYRRSGPLTVTDCNVMLGKIRPELFPALFGPQGDQPLDRQVVIAEFTALARSIAQATGQATSPVQVAAGFLEVAVETMAAAIKKISIQRGYDLADYALCCFGGAGGQHACAIAGALGVQRVIIHPYAGVLSALGMGLASITAIRQGSIEQPLNAKNLSVLQGQYRVLLGEAEAEAIARGADPQQLTSATHIYLRYQGTDTALAIPWGDLDMMKSAFQATYHQRYGFMITDRPLVMESIAITVTSPGPDLPIGELPQRRQTLEPITTVEIYDRCKWQPAVVYRREQLRPGDIIPGPALVLENTGTNFIASGWQGTIGPQLHLVLTPTQVPAIPVKQAQPVDPVQLEIFHNRFRAIAEAMGVTLQNTSYSVNIKERLDFSCALFDRRGQLVANAPHIPVHLGSMSASVVGLMQAQGLNLRPGQVYITNNPYSGGTHLPDITAIAPIFTPENLASPDFYVAARGHHADIGGLTPGSMPSDSITIAQEGILFDHWLLVDGGQLRAAALLELLDRGGARNPSQNLADLRAQIAATERGKRELLQLVGQYGGDYIQAYMEHVQDQGEQAVRQAIERLQPGYYRYELDDGSQICVEIEIDRLQRSARIDFTGTSPQQLNNLNAPLAICQAAVLYVFRTLVRDDIPLNGGCLRPLEVIVPEGSLLNPVYPAAVVAGNVETSQAIVNALYGALGELAAAQGTMNNLTFGNGRYQYYETIAGGSGAGPGFAGTSGVQTHMTNSRLTDPEVLELRFPVRLEEFSLRWRSGGRGQYSGGDGVRRCLCFLEPMTVGILSSSRRVPPFGLAGGQAGATGRNYLIRRGGQPEELGGRVTVAVEAGDRLIIETPGGGGYGVVQV